MTAQRRVSTCIVCGTGLSEALYGGTFDGTWEDAVPLFLTDREKAVHGDIRRCSGCGFTFTDPQFSSEEYASIYGSIMHADRVVGRERGEGRRVEKRWRMIERFAPGNKFIDLGCGAGHFHRAGTEYDGAGFEVRPGTGFDFHEDSRTYEGSFTEFAAAPDMSAKFDFVTAWDVLEHLSDLDDYMNAIAGILRPGGLFFSSVPDVSSAAARITGRRWNCILLEHLWYFSPSTFRQYAGKFGFEIVETGSLGFPVDVQTIALRFAQTYGGAPIRLPRFIADRVIDLPIGLMYAVCRRT